MIISLKTELNYYIDRKYENELAFQGKDGWLFSKHNYGNCSQKLIENINSNISAITLKFSKKGIKTIFAILPEKESLYSEKHNIRKFDIEIIPENLSLLCSNNFVYLKTCMENNKDKGLLFFKEDHHWTQLGAFIGYQSIINMINNIDIHPLNEDNFKRSLFWGPYNNFVKTNFFENIGTKGSTYYRLNMDGKHYSYKNYYYTYFSTNILPSVYEIGDRYAKFRGGIYNKKIMVIGDSNIGYLLPFITATFYDCCFLCAASNTKLQDDWRIGSYDNIIDEYKPDYIVVVVCAHICWSWEQLNK